MILRILLASLDPEVIEDSRRMIAETEALLSVTDSSGDMWEHLSSKPFDLLVIDADLLGPSPSLEFERIQDLPDAPETIVLLEREDHERRAALLDAGAFACVARDIERPTLYRTIRVLIRRARKLATREFMAEEASEGSYLSDFASKSPSMQEFLAVVRKVVNTNSSLLILGETGVGKEYLARAIHQESPRGGNPFVAVSCAALPETLLESELFGHVAGAFTGAQKAKRGYFELAHTGTLFLDEIGDLPLHLQVKLLRALQERTVQPIGAEKSIDVDVRVIAATNRELKKEVEADRFRSDLYYRLCIVTLTVPPLRDRREDVPDLVNSHIEHFRKTLGRPIFGIQPSAMDMLLGYSWPGNVRELINVIERAVLLAEGEEVTASDLPEDILGASHPGGSNEPAALAPPWAGRRELTEVPLQKAREELIESFERAYLQELLEQTRGRIGAAAARAGITPRSLYEKMKRLGLRKEAFKGSAGHPK